MKSKKTGMPAMRVFSFSVAGVLGLLLTSTTMPSFLGASTDRALVNAPAQLVTAPIKGVISNFAMAPGDRFAAGKHVGAVRNDDVGREKLIELGVKASELSNDLASSRAALAQATATENRLKAFIARQSVAVTEQLQAAVQGAAARLAEAEAQIAIAKDQGNRDAALLNRGVLGGNMLKSEKILEAVASQRDVAAADLAAAERRLAVAKAGIFLGPDNGQIVGLEGELRETREKMKSLRTEIDVLQNKLADVSNLQTAERERVAELTEQSIATSGDILVTRVGAAPGGAVNAGDTLAQGIDCSRAFVVAIFPERSASSLATGAPVTVSFSGWSEPVHGAVSALVPRTTAAEDTSFAVPFPPTERRELYAYINLDDRAPVERSASCSVGRWVGVSVDGAGITTEKIAAVASQARAMVARAWDVTSTAIAYAVREDGPVMQAATETSKGIKSTMTQVAELVDRTTDTTLVRLAQTFSNSAVAEETSPAARSVVEDGRP